MAGKRSRYQVACATRSRARRRSPRRAAPPGRRRRMTGVERHRGDRAGRFARRWLRAEAGNRELKAGHADDAGLVVGERLGGVDRPAQHAVRARLRQPALNSVLTTASSAWAAITASTHAGWASDSAAAMNRVPTRAPSAPAARTAATPRALAIPPAAITGTSTASSTPSSRRAAWDLRSACDRPTPMPWRSRRHSPPPPRRELLRPTRPASRSACRRRARAPPVRGPDRRGRSRHRARARSPRQRRGSMNGTMKLMPKAAVAEASVSRIGARPPAATPARVHRMSAGRATAKWQARERRRCPSVPAESASRTEGFDKPLLIGRL